MPSLAVAHVREQGVDLIIAPLAADFGHKDPGTQRAVIAEIQLRSRSAGLAGTVVPVWDGGGGAWRSSRRGHGTPSSAPSTSGPSVPV